MIVSAVGGIVPDPLGPGYKHFFVFPKMGGNISWARSEYDSVRGKIICDWKLESNTLLLNLTVPPGASATVIVPCQDAASITEDGAPASLSNGVSLIKAGHGKAVFNVESGNYSFKSEHAGQML